MKVLLMIVQMLQAESYRGLPRIIGQDEDLLCYSCFYVGCRILCQSRRRHPCELRWVYCYTLRFELLSNIIYGTVKLLSFWSTTAALGTTLVGHRKKPRVYIGCMKSGPVLSKK